jgi:MFS family permease
LTGQIKHVDSLKNNKSAWLLTVIPISAVGSGLGIIVPLYILALHGNVLNVGLAVTLYNLVAIPSSLFWGKMTDRFGSNRHKLFIIGSLVGVLPILFLLGLVKGPHAIEAIYGLYALMATAASPSINILVMGTRRDPSLPKFFSRYSIYMIFGSLLAMVPGLLIRQSGLLYYLYFLLAVNLAGLVVAWISVNELKPKQVPKEKIRAVHRLFPALNMISTLPNILTGHRLIEELHKIFDGKYRNFTFLLLAIALFNGAMNLFNTSYIPYLRKFGLGYNSIFAINIINALCQLAIYLIVAYTFSKNSDLHRYYSISAWMRGATYIVIIVPLFVAFGTFFYANMIGYAFSGVAYALWNIAASVLLYDSIRGKNEGYYIGVWVAVLGLSAVLGSFASGILSESLNYVYTFGAAAVITFVSALMFNIHRRHSNKIKGNSKQ